MNAMIIDDDPIIRDLLKRMIAPSGVALTT